jgi:hypothetical protein
MVELVAARDHIKPIEQLLIDAHETAVANWATLVREKPELARPIDAAARANFIHCHVCAEVERRVGRVVGIKPTDKLGFFGLWIEGNILLRFKFVGDGLPSNVATKQQNYLARQEYTDDMMFALAGDGDALVPPTLLTCGYTLDGDKVGRIEIRRDCVGHPSWHYEIYGGEALVEPVPFDGMADTAKPAKVSSTKLKRQEDDKQAEQA